MSFKDPTISAVLSSAAALMSGAPALPAIPEISFAKRVDNSGIAKLAVFAYRREDRQGLWQSGTQLARTSGYLVQDLSSGERFMTEPASPENQLIFP